MREVLLIAAVLAWSAAAVAEPSRAPAAEAARAMAQACSGCHGGTGMLPALASLSHAELKAQLLAFRSGARTGTLMNRIARGYTEQELRSLANHLAGRGQ